MATKEININVTTKGASVKAKKNLAHTTMKRIKITSNGPLTTKGGVRGPVLRPYMESIFNIRNMLVRDRATIIEILKDGSELQLNAENYMLDNNEVVEAVKQEAPTDEIPEDTNSEEIPLKDVVTPVSPAPAETVDLSNNEEVVPDKIPEDAKPEEVSLDNNETEMETAAGNYSNKNKKNRKNR